MAREKGYLDPQYEHEKVHLFPAALEVHGSGLFDNARERVDVNGTVGALSDAVRIQGEAGKDL